MANQEESSGFYTQGSFHENGKGKIEEEWEGGLEGAAREGKGSEDTVGVVQKELVQRAGCRPGGPVPTPGLTQPCDSVS